MSSSSEGLLERADNRQINRRKQHPDVFKVYGGSHGSVITHLAREVSIFVDLSSEQREGVGRM